LQICRVKSAASQAHDWVVHRLEGILGSVGHSQDPQDYIGDGQGPCETSALINELPEESDQLT
jgi:hypothetical protein